MKNIKTHKDDSKHLNSDYLGRCDSTEKIIYLNLDPEDWKIEMLMVHEICHAQKGCKSHGDQWKKKMQESIDANLSGTFVLRIRYVTKLKITLLSCFG